MTSGQVQGRGDDPWHLISMLEAENTRLRTLVAQRSEDIYKVPSASQDDIGYRALFEMIDSGFCIIQLLFNGTTPIDYRFLEVNLAFERQTGLTDAAGKWMRDLAPNHEQHWFDLYGKVAATGEPVKFENPADALGRWYEVQAFRIGQPEDRKVAVLFNEISRRRKAEEAQKVLNHELSHRLKNTLAMVQAIAHQTLQEVNPFEPVEAFTERVRALSAAHDVLLKSNWTSARIGSVVGRVLELSGQAKFVTAEGPDVNIGPRATMSLSLLLHELLTNAMKYGALSAEGGRAVLHWDTEGEDGDTVLRMHWRESGGPPVLPPERESFGTRLIAMGLLGTGGTELRYEETGVQAEMTARLADLQAL